MKLIPFDLERALAGDAVVTRDDDWEVVHVDDDKSDCIDMMHPLKAWLRNKNRGNVISEFTKNGHHIGGASPHKWDLFMAPKTKTYWAHVYRGSLGLWVRGAYETEEQALSDIFEGYGHVKTISFIVEQ